MCRDTLVFVLLQIIVVFTFFKLVPTQVNRNFAKNF